MKAWMAVTVWSVLGAGVAHAQEGADNHHGYLRLETGASGLAYNTLQDPRNDSGTRFSLKPLLGSGDKGFARVTYEKPTDHNHGIRLVVAVLHDTGTGTLPRPVTYRGHLFAAGTPTSAIYQFNGYRITYWSRIRRDSRGEARAGFTLNIRDARVQIAQGSYRNNFTNVGPVPLAYLAVDRTLAPRLMGYAEADAFAVPGGRAVDLNLRVGYALTRRADLLFGIRTVEGGAEEKNNLYNYIRYNYATVGIGFRL